MTNKIFCVGLSKTSTSSLSEALTILGYKSKHFPDFLMENSSQEVKERAKYNALVKPNYVDITEGTDNRLMLKPERISEFDAFSDTPISRFYKELDALYPKSKFIYTIRDEMSWLESCRKFFFHTRFDYWLYIQLHYDLYGVNEFDKEKFVNAYRKHDFNVRTYFQNRPDDLLIMDVGAGDGWEKLCGFLGEKQPNQDFPHKFKAHQAIKKNKYCRML